MPFPESERVLYERNPLAQVICQLRFPSILRIDAEVPAKFQDAIRADFPMCRGSEDVELLQVEFPEEIRKLLGTNLPFRTAKSAHTFTTDDGQWQVSLTRDWLALTAMKYERWEKFRERLRVPLEALQEIYSPPFFTRVGLRYQDVLRRSALHLDEVSWHDLLQPHIGGELAVPEIASAIEHVHRQTRIRIDDRPSHVQIRHGFARRGDSPEVCYLIDSDFYTEQRTGVNDAETILDEFNRYAGRLFRWCITERLHTAMGPRSVTG